ncbi:MotA/TolQ/ExbB proton channel family protein [Marinicella meishanensis]|uniref:MotA/TolQ/ExbB proton channel family protein n=1 Tax=Marinicella meishanensis TaxID=2873263 RepID=UPI001CBCB027|nr:MotA/TolQ/ExbB proton channel family protein [Marinicella sp. NBU2979]
MSDLIQQLQGYFISGGYVMPPLIIATLVLWWTLGYRMMALRRGSVRSTRVMVYRYMKGILPSNEGVLVRVLHKGMKLRAKALPDLRRYLDDAFAEEGREIKKYRVLITTIVLVAPLLGLLGTVSGMIETFDSLGDMSLFSQSGGIAGGISQALITTQMGLAVSIPGLIVNGILDKKQKQLEIEIAQLKDYLCSPIPGFETDRPAAV